METKEYKLSVECNRDVVSSIDITDATNMMLKYHDDKALPLMLIDTIHDWVAKQVVEHEIKNVFYEDVENAAIAVVEKIKDYVFMLRQHKNYSYCHLISNNYSLLLKENDGKVFIDMIQHNWVITCDNIKAE